MSPQVFSVNVKNSISRQVIQQKMKHIQFGQVTFRLGLLIANVHCLFVHK